jgi:ATP synthase protein I
MNKKPPPSVWGSLALMGQLGFTIAIPLALGAWGGSYLDGLTNTKSLYLLLGLLLGLIVGVYGAYRLFSRFF